MMAYQALYRTYRPQAFREVVGQEVVVKTLQNALANNKISHAYLLSGPRGTGKTTVARIFAKVLNCKDSQMQEPCNRCISCHEISDSMSPDVIEIDAASNNGVDEIRELRDKVKFLPSGTAYKIYIIDEVHMLSAGAFNALLKTLEEPPKHAIFILATTEPQKIPATIISRCQRFDFKSLSVNEITKKLRVVCSEEGFEITEEALNAIAEAAEGGLRDAMSTLDQAISYSNGKITIEEVNRVTGNLSYDKLIELATFFNLGDVNSALEVINELIDLGKEVSKLVSGLLQFYRDMLLFKNVDSLIYSKYIYEKDKFKILASNTTLDKIFYYIDILSDVQAKIRYSQTPRIYLEIAIIKMINMSSDDLNYIKRIENLENRLENLSSLDFNHESLEVDEEKTNIIEKKINNIITELSKLDLPKLTQRVEELERGKPTISGNKIDGTHIEKELEALQESVLLFRSGYNNLKNQVDNLMKEDTQLDHQELMKRLEYLEKQSRSSYSQNIENDLKYIQEDVDALKLILAKQAKISNVVTSDEEVTEIKEKVGILERKLYELLATQLSTKVQTNVKKTKKTEEQIGLFTEDLTPRQDLSKVPEQVDFKELAKPIEPINQEIEQEDTLKPKQHQEEIIIEHEGRKETVIDKPQSRLVISNSKDVDLFAREKELMEKEIETIRPVPIPIQEEVDLTQAAKGNDSYAFNREINRFASYDIKLIENILHDARNEAARNDMKRLISLWDRLDRSASIDYLGTIDLLKEGRIAAVGNKEFILTFKSASLCNQTMRASFKAKALRIFHQNLGDTYNYISLPDKIWLEKRAEYSSQYTIGIKYPKLTPINDPELEIIEPSMEYKDPKDKIVHQTIDLFGDIVKTEE